MEAPLEVVRDKKTGDVLFYKRSHPPFKTVSLSIDSPNNSSIDVLPSKNEHVIASNFRNAAAAEQVSLNFGDNYGFEQNYLLLEEKLSSANSRNQEQSKILGELAIAIATPEILEDIRSLSQDVYKLSSTEDMLNQFEQQSFF
uniref:Uncharacterized protein n=1 Tax=Solanum tuberosum TaxID=4113 RepID=M1DNT8_SOLTU